MDMKAILDRLPFNGYKSYIGIGAAALVLGLQQLGYLDPQIGAFVLELVVAWTGISIYHKELKQP